MLTFYYPYHWFYLPLMIPTFCYNYHQLYSLTIMLTVDFNYSRLYIPSHPTVKWVLTYRLLWLPLVVITVNYYYIQLYLPSTTSTLDFTYRRKQLTCVYYSLSTYRLFALTVSLVIYLQLIALTVNCSYIFRSVVNCIHRRLCLSSICSVNFAYRFHFSLTVSLYLLSNYYTHSLIILIVEQHFLRFTATTVDYTYHRLQLPWFTYRRLFIIVFIYCWLLSLSSVLTAKCIYDRLFYH